MSIFNKIGSNTSLGISFEDEDTLEVNEFNTPENIALLEAIIRNGQSSKLLYWDVENFAQYRKERFEFGDNGVLVLKAFNSSGKTNALKALQYALTTTGVSITLAKNMISYGQTRAKITTVWSDGVEIEYHMRRSSANRESKSVKFTNGYRMFIRQDGERKEVFNTLVNGKFTRITETPSVIKRYFNLTEVDGKYLNFMRKGAGMQVLEQTPASLNKTLSRASDTETSEKVIKRINSDNKDTLQDLNANNNRIEIFTKDVVERRHLTDKVLAMLSDGVSEYKQGQQVVETVDKIQGYLKSVLELKTSVKAPELDLDGLAEIVSIINYFEDLKNSPTLPTAPKVDVSVLKALSQLLGYLEELNEVSDKHVLAPVPELSTLRELSRLIALVEQNEAQVSFGQAPDVSAGVSTLKVLAQVQEDLLKLNDFDNQIQDLQSSIEGMQNEMDGLLQTLKAEGHPVGVCSHCGHLSITQPFEVGGVRLSAHAH